MKIACPYCQHRLTLQDPKPGRFQPKCPKCHERFLLVVPANADEPPRAEKLAVKNPVASQAPAQQTVAQQTRATPPVDSTDSTNSPSTPSASGAAPNLETTWAAPASTKSNKSETVTAEAEQTLASSPPPAPSPSGQTGGVEQTMAFSAPHAADTTIVHTSTASGPARRVPASGAPAVDATKADATIAHAAGAATAVDPAGPSGAGTQLPDSIGGYRIVRQLGHGAMGDVYLARQVSLDRDVALKTIRSQWAKNPAFIARFTREAYAAAQLVHHNIVQIYDLGVDGEFHYFSMEFVRGEALDQLLKREGPLAPRVAAGYILQAARGLLYAHQLGMVHRDIKPANLMLNDQGLIKVADMGLVKVPITGNEAVPAVESSLGVEGTSSGVASGRSAMLRSSFSATLTHFAVGTPAYMPPEQADDAASVDHRADIYSLGCTLYALLSGRSPFDGASVLEILDKHRTQPIELPSEIREQTPRELLAIAERMTAKQPSGRHGDLQQVIDELDRFLHGANSDVKPFRPEDADELERGFQAFNSAPGKSLRRWVTLGGLGAGLGLAVFSLPFSMRLSLGVLAWLVSTIVAYVIIAGVRDRTYLFGKLRQALGSLRWSDWISGALGGLILLLLLLALLGIVGTLAVGVLAIGTAWAFYSLVDQRLARQRVPAIEQLERLLKHRRLAGVDEAALREFVARNTGAEWEEGYEQLFGYEALLSARETWGRDPQGRTRPRFRPWRDPLLRWIDARVQAARDYRSRKVLAQVEARQLVSAGMTPSQAKEQATAMAEGLVRQAAAARTLVEEEAAKVVDPRAAAEMKRQRIKAMLAAARSGEACQPQKSTSPVGLLLAPLRWAISPQARFLTGCLLLASGIWWASLNGLLSRSTLDQAKAAAQATQSPPSGRLLAVLDLAFPVSPQSLPLPVVGSLFTSIVPGVAGLVLVMLSIGRGWKWSLGSALSAGLMLFGPSLGVPGIASLGGPSATCLILGLGIAAAVFVIPVGRK